MVSSKSLNAIPASYRKPVLSSRFAQGLMCKASSVMADAGARSVAAGMFVKLPHEPEDARMTGVTRSLNRRLLALNVKGSRYEATLLDHAKRA